MEESVIFEKNGVLVTDKRIVVGTNTAPIVNIHSVSLGKRKFILGYLLSIVDAIVACLAGFAMLVSRPIPAWGYLFILALIGIFFLGLWVAEREAIYSVKLSGKFGFTEILKSKDKEFILSVIEAINSAIVDRL